MTADATDVTAETVTVPWLPVAETFGPTLQGEGPGAGRNVHFLRLSGCNLDCGTGPGATWHCDTPYTWDWQRYDRQVEMRRVTVDDLAGELGDVEALVITGGEPLLHRGGLTVLIAELRRRGRLGWVEVETNGTRMPLPRPGLVDRYNVSPKLGNSGVAYTTRVVPGALAALQAEPGVVWKFVCAEPADLPEVALYADGYNLAPVWVMPAGTTAAETLERARRLAGPVLARGWNLTLRGHILLWGDERGR